MSKTSPISILCAGPGLGFYIPGILAQRQLNQAGLAAVVHVFEGFLVEHKKQNVPKAKINFHRNFSFALMGQNLAKDPSSHLDDYQVEKLLLLWQKEQRRHFIVFSGFWIPLLKRYSERVDKSELFIDLCHVDSAPSTSWSLFDTSSDEYNHIWFNNWEDKQVSYYIDVSGEQVIPYEKRRKSYLIHGGGWGMGTYKDKLNELNRSKLMLDVIAYEYGDLDQRNELNNYYMIDPQWNTWDLNQKGLHQFPPFGEVDLSGKVSFRENFQYPEIYKIIRKSKAIISKPGAGTLLDSLSSATPLICLKPFGGYEDKNALLWEHFGLGVSFEKWEASGFSEKLLCDMHKNLVEMRASAKDYIKTYINNFVYGT